MYLEMTSIMSMTGFGQAQGESPLGLLIVELRTVNNRFQDISITLPRELSALEMPLRLILKQEIPRGRIDCRVRYTPGPQAASPAVLNIDAVKAWLAEFTRLEELGLKPDLALQ